MNITIFGGTRPKAGDPAFSDAENLGSLMARAGHAVITGGYMGTMEAVSKGASEAGGKVVGITCQQIEDWRGGKANAWVTHEIKTATIQERMIMLMDFADVLMALPGGIGTLAEISLFWNRMVIEASPRKPLILIGPGWRTAIAALADALDGYFPPNHLEYLSYVDTIEEAAQLVNNHAASLS